MQGPMQAVSVAYVPMTRSYWATSAAGHVTVIDPRGPTRITDYVRNTRQAALELSGAGSASQQAITANGQVPDAEQ